MTTALEGGEGSASRPGRSLPPGKTRYPLYRRLGGPQGRSGKSCPPPGFDPHTVQPVTSLYTDWAIPANFTFVVGRSISLYGINVSEWPLIYPPSLPPSPPPVCHNNCGNITVRRHQNFAPTCATRFVLQFIQYNYINILWHLKFHTLHNGPNHLRASVFSNIYKTLSFWKILHSFYC